VIHIEASCHVVAWLHAKRPVPLGWAGLPTFVAARGSIGRTMFVDLLVLSESYGSLRRAQIYPLLLELKRIKFEKYEEDLRTK
jgi:hypothetical protein